jgi:glycosyltransferase involved in cell wall biosynthesis
MRVTMLVRCLAMMRGGGETRHLAWARELTALGVEVDIVTGQPLLFGSTRYPVEGVRATTLRSPYARDLVYRLQNRRGFGRLTMHALHADEEWFCRIAWRHIAETLPPPDVVHAHALHQAARLRRRDTPVVINLPGAPNPRYVADLRQADALIADGWAADQLPGIIGQAVQRVSKGVDGDQFSPHGPSVRDMLKLRDRPVVLTVARLVPIKNVALLLDATAVLRERIPDLHLLVVGDGPEAEALRDQAALRDMADAVTFTGYIPQAETPRYYRAADVFGLSSDFDNSPNVVLEAMACGLPVVATDVGGVREFVADRKGGAIVPPRDAAALAEGLGQYLSSARLAKEAGAFNRNRAVAEFSWRASGLRLLEIYEHVIASRKAA